MSGKVKILVVEDQAVIAEDLKQTLQGMGYDVPAVVYSGEFVLDTTAEERPDLILMDISLGKGDDGIMVAEKVRARFDIPVIYLSSHADDETFQRSLLTGPFAFLLKPFDSLRLRQTIQIALAKHAIEKQLKESSEQYRTIFEVSGSAMMIVDENGTIAMVNEEFEHLSGYPREAVEYRKEWSDFFVMEQFAAKEIQQCLKGTANGAASLDAASLFIGNNQRTSHVCTKIKKVPGTERCVVSLIDITEIKRAEEEIRTLNAELIKVNILLKEEVAERRNSEKQLQHQASHDALTGLPNRELLFDRLKQALAYEDRHNNLLALMILDLDNFKTVNDTLGHVVGDILLKDVAKRLQQCMRQYDTVARFGGDEFVIVVNEMPDIHDIVKFAEKVQELFQRPFYILEQPTYVTTSIGISIYPLQSTTVEGLLKTADMAMYQAKREGKNSFQFFTESMSLKSDERAIMKKRLRSALEREEFLPHYQPRIDATTGKITGMEALMRWQPKGAPLAFPVEFFPMLEESGLIVPAGEWLLDKVCRQNKTWQDRGMEPLRVAVNTSARQFHQDDFTEKVAQALSATRLDPHYLEIELPEKIIMDNITESVRKLGELREIGVKISLDNFGTGYSSLSHLNRLPIDELQIDKSLVNSITFDPGEAAVVSAIITMGHSLGKKLVAEGVESEDQYLFLAHQRCEEMQGHYFSRPLPPDDFEKLVRLFPVPT
ncbi:EAL domain-containing protein [Oryzomonas japonica]|uniref:EAL domain-containing protein n=1 Tax=Oryzomonas japonica TaxID=2603858 RepID=A0A7J4ZU07_9BACT|nr:GGDEF domain-containing response regulator [Oryzomonas japonica]KAB0666285.1 EAL domain-containing protein [Oryzomonas japonica]